MENDRTDRAEEVATKVNEAMAALASSIAVLQSAYGVLAALRPMDMDEAQATSFADLVARDAEWIGSHIKPLGTIARRVLLKSLGNRRPLTRVEEGLIHLQRTGRVEEVRLDRRLAYRWLGDDAGVPTPGRADPDRLPYAVNLVSRLLERHGTLTRSRLAYGLGGRILTEMIDAAIADLTRHGRVETSIHKPRRGKPTKVYTWVKSST